MNIPHVFIEPGDCRSDGVTLHGDTAHDLMTVLRRQVGDAVSVADGSGTVRQVAVAFDDRAGEVTVGVGPEGGLAAQEIAMAGPPAVSLGGTVLRTETASVVAPALVLHRLSRLG